MNRRSLWLVQFGITLFIFGPVLGYVLSITGLFQTQHDLLLTPPRNINDLHQYFEKVHSRTFANLVPMLVGWVCGSVGFFLILIAFLTHFFGPKENA